MTRYTVHFLDYGGNIYTTRHIDRADDEVAVATAHDLNILPRLSRFEVWAGDRLVHRHPDSRDIGNPRPTSSSSD